MRYSILPFQVLYTDQQWISLPIQERKAHIVSLRHSHTRNLPNYEVSSISYRLMLQMNERSNLPSVYTHKAIHQISDPRFQWRFKNLGEANERAPYKLYPYLLQSLQSRLLLNIKKAPCFYITFLRTPVKARAALSRHRNFLIASYKGLAAIMRALVEKMKTLSFAFGNGRRQMFVGAVISRERKHCLPNFPRGAAEAKKPNRLQRKRGSIILE